MRESNQSFGRRGTLYQISLLKYIHHRVLHEKYLDWEDLTVSDAHFTMGPKSESHIINSTLQISKTLHDLTHEENNSGPRPLSLTLCDGRDTRGKNYGLYTLVNLSCVIYLRSLYVCNL